MTWKGWAALAAGILIVALTVSVSYYRQQKWLLEDSARVAEIDHYRGVAVDAHRRANKFSVQVDTHQKEIAALNEDLEKARKWRKNRIRPKTLTECHKQLEEFDIVAARLERTLALEQLTVFALRGQTVELEQRGDNLEAAWQRERKRAEGYRKIGKREKIKKVFIGVGSGLAGGAIVGIAVGATN